MKTPPKERYHLALRDDVLESLKLLSSNRPMPLIDSILTSAVNAFPHNLCPDSLPAYPEEATRKKYGIRITAATLAALRLQASASYRSTGNHIELLLVQYLESHGKLNPCPTLSPSPSTTVGEQSPKE